MAGYNPGLKRLIEEWMPGEPRQNGQKWYMKAKLSCGHIVDVSVGMSPNHRRPGTPHAIQSGRCIECWKEKEGL